MSERQWRGQEQQEEKQQLARLNESQARQQQGERSGSCSGMGRRASPLPALQHLLVLLNLLQAHARLQGPGRRLHPLRVNQRLGVLIC